MCEYIFYHYPFVNEWFWNKALSLVLFVLKEKLVRNKTFYSHQNGGNIKKEELEIIDMQETCLILGLKECKTKKNIPNIQIQLKEKCTVPNAFFRFIFEFLL